MPRYILSHVAQEDLLAIKSYTHEHWGDAQVKKYLEQLSNRFTSLTENPALGRERPEIAKGCRSIVEGKHLILYRVQDNGDIEILAVPHGSRDLDHYSGNIQSGFGTKSDDSDPEC